MNPAHFHSRKTGVSLALFWLLFTLSDSLPAKQGPTMSNTITYTSTVADEHFATRLLITPDGLGKLSLGSNRDSRERSIGQFQQAIPPKLLQNLASTVSGPEFVGSASQKALVPDEAFREIKLIAPNQQQTVKMIGEELATPAAFGKAEQALQEIIDYLQRFPVVSIAMRVSPLPTLVEAGTSATIDITLRNLGRTAYFVESPKAWGKQATHCELKATRSDIPLAQLGSQHQVFVQLDGSIFTQSNPPQTEDLFGLMPGEQLNLSFQQAINWPPGHYAVDVSLALSLFKPDKKTAFIGGMVSPPQALEVRAPAQR